MVNTMPDEVVKYKSPGNKQFEALSKRQIITNSDLVLLAKREEARLLSLLLNDKDSLIEIVDHRHITVEHFLHLDHCYIYQTILGNYTRFGTLLTRDSLRSLVEQYSGDDTAVSRWLNLYESFRTVAVSPEDLPMLVEGLISRAAQNNLFNAVGGGNALVDIWKAKDSDQHIAIRKLIDKMESSLSSVVHQKDSFFSADLAMNLANDFLADVEEAKRTPLRERAILCGLKCIDDEFFGFGRGKYMIILGFPNGGKTTIMLNFAANMARSGYRVGYVTVESSGKEVVGRLLSRRSKIPSKKFKNFGPGGMTDKDLEHLNNVKDEFEREEGANLFVITVNQLTPINEVLALTDKYSAAVGGFDVVFFDYLEVFGVPKGRGKTKDRERYLELTLISQSIQTWGKARGILSVTAQSIKNTKIEEFRKKDFLEKAEKSDLFVGVESVGGAQAISRDADYVLAAVTHPRNNQLVIYVTKARSDGKANTRWVVGWDGAICEITDITGNWIDTGTSSFVDKRFTPGDIEKCDSKAPKSVSELFQYFHRRGTAYGNNEPESSVGGELYLEKIFSQTST